MVQSRREALATIAAAAGLTACAQWTPAFAQQHPPPPPAPSASSSSRTPPPPGLDGPQITAPKQTQGELNRQLQANIRIEVEKLCQMSNELRVDIMRANPSETLSVAFVKKAQAIEKLAKQIKEHAKG